MLWFSPDQNYLGEDQADCNIEFQIAADASQELTLHLGQWNESQAKCHKLRFAIHDQKEEEEDVLQSSYSKYVQTGLADLGVALILESLEEDCLFRSSVPTLRRHRRYRLWIYGRSILHPPLPASRASLRPVHNITINCKHWRRKAKHCKKHCPRRTRLEDAPQELFRTWPSFPGNDEDPFDEDISLSGNDINPLAQSDSSLASASALNADPQPSTAHYFL